MEGTTIEIIKGTDNIRDIYGIKVPTYSTVNEDGSKAILRICDALGYGVAFVFEDNQADKAQDMINSLISTISQATEVVLDINSIEGD